MRPAFRQIREWIDFACDTCGCPEMKHNIHFEFCGKLTQRLADATSKWWVPPGAAPKDGRSRWKSGRIRLSRVLWARCPEDEQKNTVIHEACHLICDHQGKTRGIHGAAWKAVMIQCGEKPERCHSIDRTGIRRRRWAKRVYCGCPHKTMGATQYGRLKKGTYQYTCNTCGERMRIEQ